MIPAVRVWMQAPEIREAVEALVGTYGLTLSLEDGWLKATWMPVGFFVFPGRFERERWRSVLEHMHLLAESLETRATHQS